MNKQELQIMQLMLEQLQMINQSIDLLTKKYLANLKETRKLSRNKKTTLNESKQKNKQRSTPHEIIEAILNQQLNNNTNERQIK